MGSQTRKLRRHTTGLSRDAARRVAHNLSEHLMRQPTSDAVQAQMQAELAKLNAHERVNLIAGQLSATEIRRRLTLPHEEQIAMYGFALRGGVSLLPEQPALEEGYAEFLGAEEADEFSPEPQGDL